MHPFTKCEGVVKEIFLKEQLEPAYRACGLTMPDNKLKLKKLVTYQMRRARRIVISPEATNSNFKKAKLGDMNAEMSEARRANDLKNNKKNNKKNNSKNNSKNSKKISEKNEASKMLYFQQLHPEMFKQILTDEEISSKVTQIVNNPSLFNGISLADIVSHAESEFTFYVGMTKRDLEMEDLRFLTKRGANLQKGKKYIKGKKAYRNPPVLLNANGSVITRKNAVSQLKFNSVVVFENPVLSNVTAVEDAIQKKFQWKKLGYERLWRHAAKGQHHSTELAHYKVFVTYSFNVVENINNKKIIVNK